MDPGKKEVLLREGAVAPVRQTSRSRGFQWKKASSYGPYLFLAPYFAIVIVFTVFVLIKGIRTSLTDAQGIFPGELIWLDNFIEALKTEAFIESVGRSFYFAIGCLVTQIPGAFILAVLLNNLPRGIRGPVRVSFYVPVLINSVVIALIFRTLFNQDTGAINWFLGVLGFPSRTDWLFHPARAMPIMIVISFWQWTGYHMVYMLASLQAIDPVIYEVAKLDGAGWWRTLLQITLPNMRPAITFVMVTSAIGALQLFELPFLLFYQYSYGPNESGMTMVPYIYREAFSQQMRLGYATAVSWLCFLVILIVSLFQLKMLGLGKVEGD